MAPVVEIADQKNLFSAGKPFPYHPSCLRLMYTEKQISVCKIRQGRRIFYQLPAMPFKGIHPKLNFSRIGCKPRVNTCNLIGWQ